VGPALTATALSARTESWLVSFILGHNTGTGLSSAQVTGIAQWLKGSTSIPAPAPTPTPSPTPTPAPTPTPTPQVVSYSATIAPMLNQYCNSCHATQSPRLTTYAQVYSARSRLPGMGSSYLSAAQEQTLAAWISQGASNN
jgi:hypothetical protein